MEGFNGYAGDAAWTEWFRICSVDGCAPESRARLRAEVASAMFAQLGRFGLPRDAANGDDPVSFFDGYFKLKGSRERGKPLKLYFAHRIRAERIRLLDFVCGTLFGSRSGRIHDIVVDWISSLKGWKARIMCGEDGRRRLVWESTGETEKVVELPIEDDVASALDVEAVRLEAVRLLERVAGKSGVEKPRAALLLYVTAMDVSLTEKTVLGALGVAKSMAYRLKDKVMAALQREFRTVEGAEDPLFGRVLLETCAEAVPADVRCILEGAAE